MELNYDKIEKCKRKLKRYEAALQGYENSIKDIYASKQTRMAAAKDYFEAASEAMWKLMSFFAKELYLDGGCDNPRKSIELFYNVGNINKNQKDICISIVSLRNRASHEYDSELKTLEDYYIESLSYIDTLIFLTSIFNNLLLEYEKTFNMY